MKVKVSNILKMDSGRVDIDVDNICLEWQDKYCNVSITDPIGFCGNITNVEDSLLLKGKLSFTYETNCFRCLDAVKVSKSIEVFEHYKNKADEGDEVYSFDGNVIDLSSAFKENIVLNLPMKNLCNEDCKGLCYKCGVNLNVGACGCKGEDYVNPDFEALKKWI